MYYRHPERSNGPVLVWGALLLFQRSGVRVWVGSMGTCFLFFLYLFYELFFVDMSEHQSLGSEWMDSTTGKMERGPESR